MDFVQEYGRYMRPATRCGVLAEPPYPGGGGTLAPTQWRYEESEPQISSQRSSPYRCSPYRAGGVPAGGGAYFTRLGAPLGSGLYTASAEVAAP